ncbi:multicopper oxidase domain-containing protein [Methylomarinum sp. Ch1-1]|uniref:Multicopper oxidase CueO n=1 Tax=Methylomarinum roseum TaxID=3067653 RepID=A0AAU7NVK0_9GAMM|nr:multicopper oxidase domain-containing protein [Methylomarinum sp. Ch1-1]MDP4522954.1 multicopper oxidase domain-containing protein [Methylomarinum sp. Ch1-1]
MTIKRRQILKAGAAALTTPAIFGGAMLSKTAQAQLCRPTGIRSPGTEPDSPPVTPFTEPLFIPDALSPVNPASLTTPPDPNRHQRFDEFQPIKYYEQRITEGYWNYHSELTQLTPNQSGSLAWMYNGSTPGETLVARYGEPVFVRRYNDLPTADQIQMPIGYPAISTHLHNAHTASESDGYPMDFAEPGQFWDHHYAMMYARNDPNEALASLWYHDHMIDFTATNVYAGLSGMAIFYDHIDSGDENDKHPHALRLPGNMRFGGAPGSANGYDISLILHDVRFDSSGNPAYNVFDTDGHLGDLITVNRKVMPYLNVERRKYRFRIYDGGPSRFYELQLGDGDPFFIISNDGNLLEEPVEATSIVLGPANRQDVIIDFSRYSPGQTVEFFNVMEQINGQGPSGRRLDGPSRMNVMQFRIIDSNVEDNSQIPDFMRKLPPINLNEVVAEREWVFDHDMGLWTVNGSFMDPTIISAAPRQGTAEIWHFRNAGSSWAHPCHVHFEEFQVLEWNGKKPTGVLRSRKDVATLGPNDHAKVFYRFDDFVGRYVIHCHNNVHEDNAMMLRWDITPG